MEIIAPIIYRDRGKWTEYDILLKNFIRQYNEDKEECEYLREGHLRLMHECLKYVQSVLRQMFKGLTKEGELKVYKGEPIRINLSTRLEDHKTLLTHKTYQRYKKRLQTAGFLTSKQEDFDKYGIRRRRRSDVLIMPEFLLIYDISDSDYQPHSPYFTENDLNALKLRRKARGKKNKKGTDCPSVTGIGNLKEPDPNNRIMDVDNVEKGVPCGHELPKIPEQDLLPDTPTKQGAQDSNSNKKNVKKITPPPPQTVTSTAPPTPEQGPGGARAEISAPEIIENSQKLINVTDSASISGSEPDDLGGLKAEIESEPVQDPGVEGGPIEKSAQSAENVRDLRWSYARTFFIYMAGKLFTNHEIYKGEAQRSIEYITKTYFSTVTTEHEARYFLSRCKHRVDLAASYIRRNRFDFSNIYPYHYLNVNNKKGFVATKKWQQDSSSYRKGREERRRLYDKMMQEQAELKMWQDRYMDQPTVSEVQRAMTHLSDNLSHLQEKYKQFVDNQLQML